MSYSLQIVVGPDAGKSFPISAGPEMTIGRGENTDVQLSDKSVSRNQFQLSFDGTVVTLKDEGSRWGTLVNGEKVTKRALRNNDRIKVGETVLQLVENDAATETLLPSSQTPSPSQGSDDPWRNIQMKRDLLKMVNTSFLHYEISKVLAEAQTGVVFLAHDTKRNQPVALKVFAREYLSQDRGFDRFVRAMKTMLPLKHPNLVRVLHAGKSSGLCYMVSEYIQGQSVAELIERVGISGMLDWENTLRTGIDVAEALCFAEEHNIVHRNITPRNILIRKEDGRALLGDLMFAKAFVGPHAEEITIAGELVGALAYMSPEQTLGGELDCRSDIYSLGAALYGMLTGKPPLEGKNAAMTIVKIQNEMPQSASSIQLSVPPLLNDVIMGMLAKEPEKRPQTAAKLLSDLRRVAKYQGKVF